MVKDFYQASVANIDTTEQQGWLYRLHIDWPLFIAVMLLCCIGLVILFSASGESTVAIERQFMRILLAFLIMIVMAQIPITHLRRWSLPVFLIGSLMLVGVLLVGDTGKGAQRWLDLGVVRFQPSELLKLAVPMVLSWLFSGGHLPPTWPRILIALFFMAVPALLIAQQPDLGTALLVVCAGVLVLFLAGLSWRIIIMMAVFVVSAAPLLWFFMRDYQRQRVLTFLDPQSDPLGAGYHIIQSQIAIGSGGLYGKGWLQGTQSHLEFLPERSTDFIFAVLGEEFGLVGIVLLLSVYLFIIFRGLYISVHAPTVYARLLGGSLTMIFFVYLFVNTGMVVGLLPVVGVPLPLISYGGTSLVTLMAGFGILMAIATMKKTFSI
jgi:rod shape determining protein RodA